MRAWTCSKVWIVLHALRSVMIERDDESSDELGVFSLKQWLIRVIGRKGAFLHFGSLMLVCYCFERFDEG